MDEIDLNDLVECINTKPIRKGVKCSHSGENNPPKGSIRRVTMKITGSCGCVWICLNDNSAGLIERFRKIRPADKDIFKLAEKSKKKDKIRA